VCLELHLVFQFIYLSFFFARKKKIAALYLLTGGLFLLSASLLYHFENCQMERGCGIRTRYLSILVAEVQYALYTA
jgi:hypothetical protein